MICWGCKERERERVKSLFGGEVFSNFYTTKMNDGVYFIFQCSDMSSLD